MDQDQARGRLEALMLLAARDAGATRAAVFAPTGTGLALAAQWALDQAALDIAHSGWARHRAELTAGKTVRYGQAVLWPLFSSGRDVCALVYLDKAPADFPDERGRANGAAIAAWMPNVKVPTPGTTYMASRLAHVEVVAEILADQLALLLRFFRGNVSAVANHLGVARMTVYDRIGRYQLDLAEFRPRRLRRT
jgi:hypothetical protein